MKRMRNLTVLAGLATVMTLSLGGVATASGAWAAEAPVQKSNSTAQEGTWYGPFGSTAECERARVLFDYSTHCSYRVGDPDRGVGWYFYGGFN